MNFARNSSISIARQVGKNHFRLRLARPSYFKKIDRLGASGSGTGFRNLSAQQGIDDAGFTNVRPSKKCNLGSSGGREVGHTGGRSHKSRKDPHNSVSGFQVYLASGEDN